MYYFGYIWLLFWVRYYIGDEPVNETLHTEDTAAYNVPKNMILGALKLDSAGNSKDKKMMWLPRLMLPNRL